MGFFKIIFYFISSVFCLHVCKCTTCMPGVWKPKKKKVLEPTKLELQTAVSFHVGAGSRAFISEENALNN